MPRNLLVKKCHSAPHTGCFCGLTISRLGRATLSTCLSLTGLCSLAGPQDGNITSGSGKISQNGSTSTILQNSQRMAVDWSSFSIRPNETVNFVQPNAQAIALNRVTGREASSILGHLNANGNVFILNPNGVLFGAGAQVSVGGLLASTLNMSNADFEAGQYRLSGTSTASVSNQGSITVPTGGKVALVAATVSNAGQINAPEGSVALVAANGIHLELNDGSPIGYTITQGAAQALVDNGGVIAADGGQVVLTAKGLQGLNDAVVNHSGVIRARTVAQRNGQIELLADGGTAQVNGTLDVRGQGAADRGGTVKVLGDKVGLFDAATIDASGPAGGGTVLVGGNRQGLGPEVNASAAYMAPTAVIDASAGQTGDGGKVVVWGTDVANVYGRIRATGGAQGGNGGAIETSGHALDTQGVDIDVSARHGTSGSWLLDPYNVTISSGSQTGGAFSSNVWAPTASGSLVNTSNIQTILNSGGSVTITTTGAGAEEGNISINGNILKSAGSAASLTLVAAGRILDNGTAGTHRTISSSSNALNVSMTSNATSTTAGNNSLKLQFMDISANGGNISLTATGAQNGTAAAMAVSNTTLSTSGSGNISLTGTMPSNGNSQGVLLTANTLSTASGTISIQGTSGGIASISGFNASGAALMTTSNIGLRLAGTNSVTSSGGGNITLNGVATGATSTWAGGGVQLGAGDTISTTGTVNITGTTSNPSYTSYRNQLSAVNFSGNTSTAINVTGGTVNISGINTTVGQAGTTSNSNAALKLAGKINITASSGPVNLTGSNTGGDGVWGSGTANTTVSISAPSSSAVNINAASLDSLNGYSGFYVGGSATLSFLTTAAVNLSTQTAETSTHNSLWNKGTINTPGNLNIVSTAGAIYDDGGVGLFSNVGGTTSITSTGGGNTISLTNASNVFAGAVSLNAGATSLVNSTALTLGSSSIAGALSLTAPGITQNAAVSVSGATALNAGTHGISLTNTGNDFNTLSVTHAAGVAVVDANALGVTGVSSTAGVQLTTRTQDLTTSGTFAVSNGDLTLTAGADHARGTSTGGDVVNAATLSVDSGQKIYVYSGAVDSTTLNGSLATQAAAGSGNFRYNRQSGDAPGTSSVGDGNTYVMYREQPVLGVTPSDPSKVYDKNTLTDPSLGYALSNQRNGDTAAQILTGQLSRVSGQSAGSYTIGQGTLADQLGYDVQVATGHAFTVTPRPVTVAANSATKVYDNAASSDPSFTYVATGLLSGDALSGSLGRASGQGAGSYAINQGSLANANYSIGFTGNTFTITPASLLISADNAARLIGQNNPAFSATYSGFVAGENVANAGLSGNLLFSTPATSASAPGRYAVVPSGLSSTNYQLSYAAGTLTVLPSSWAAVALTPLSANVLGYEAGMRGASQPLSDMSPPNLMQPAAHNGCALPFIEMRLDCAGR